MYEKKKWATIRIFICCFLIIQIYSQSLFQIVNKKQYYRYLPIILLFYLLNCFLQLPSDLKGAEESYLVGIFQIAAHGNTVGKTADLDICVSEQL